MSFGNATLAVGCVLLALAGFAWIWLWAESEPEHRSALAREHLPALADCALVALTLHAVGLIAAGDPKVGPWAVTIVLAAAAAALRKPPGERANVEDDELPEPQPEPEPQVVSVRPVPDTLWARRQP